MAHPNKYQAKDRIGGANLYIADRLVRARAGLADRPHRNGSGLYSGRLPDGCGRCRPEGNPPLRLAGLQALSQHVTYCEHLSGIRFYLKSWFKPFSLPCTAVSSAF